MKELIGILILVFMFSGKLIAEDVNYWNSFKLNKDVMKGYNTEWNATCTYTDNNKCLAPDYAYNLVDKKNNYPVRLGSKSLRFEIRSGDCHQRRPGLYNDCKATPPSERHEFNENWDKTTTIKGTTWHFHSMYLPEDTPEINSEWITMGQFHNIETSYPPINFDLKGRSLQLVSRFACQHPKKYKKNVPCHSDDPENRIVEIIDNDNLFGKWNDFIINAKWSSDKKKGYFKLWVNGKLAYHFKGITVAKGNQGIFMFGIYRGAARGHHENSAHVVFYDELRMGYKSCKKLKLKDLGYSCKDLESQKIKNIHTISEPKTEIGKLSQEERYIKTLTNRISKKIIIANSLSDDKAKKVIKWVNKELVKWSKDDEDEINTVGGRKEKMQSLTKKGIKKFK